MSEEEYRPPNRQRISRLEGRINAQQQSIRRLFDDLNALKATALDHGQLFYRYGELEAQLITRIDALENPPDAVQGEGENSVQDDFPCCTNQSEPAADFFRPTLSKWQFQYLKDLVETDVRCRWGSRNFYTLAEDLLAQLQQISDTH